MADLEDPLNSGSRFELLVQSVTDYAIYMLDPAGHVTSWNAGARRFKGYEPEEIIGEHFSRFYTPEERAQEIPRIALETAEREGRFEAEGWRVRKDGTRFWANVVIDPIRDPAGRLIGFAKVTRDLTDRRAAEEELRASEEHFRLLVQSVTDYAIYMLDKQGRVSSWNAGAERFKGYAASEIIGEHFSRFYSEEDREAGIPRTALYKAEHEGRFEAEGWRIRKDGSRFWASVIIDPVRNDEGELIGFAKVTRDLSDKRAIEEQLRQSQKMEAVGQLTRGAGARFQQPADRDQRQPRDVKDTPGARADGRFRSLSARRRRRGEARLGADSPAARIRAAADARSQADRRQPASERSRRAAASKCGVGDRRRDRRFGQPLADAGRFQPARERGPQLVYQRA
jgi:PAS domain S-box-containing protein